MNFLIFFIVFPLIISILMLLVKNNTFRNITVIASSIIISSASVIFLILNFGKDAVFFEAHNEIIDYVIFGCEALLSLYIFITGIRNNKYFVSLLVLLQFGLMVAFEFFFTHHIKASNNLFYDQFSVIMVVIIGVIASLICIYSLSYMKHHQHHHPEFKDRRNKFFAIMFLFMSAMFGIVCANNLTWLYLFWEITTLCSFLLIGYNQNPISKKNSFTALTFNLIGGVAFAGAISYTSYVYKIVELDQLLAFDKNLALIPAVLLAFAGLTKAAQFPFSSWLLGAMVAPTPVSALLHSSTMVKAGVYIIIKFAPVFTGTIPGIIIAFIGGLTFLFASFIAITQRDAKRLLAYSTIANLGLIVACGGSGTYEAVWAGILLIIFHALAKSLLFLSVGTVEHKIGSRDIESMDNLIMKLPKLTILLFIGIAGMFLAPFGMLISKWVTLKAFIDVNPILAIILAYGSAATVFFWTKWLGKIITFTFEQHNIEKDINSGEWSALYILGACVIVICGLFYPFSLAVIQPYVKAIYGASSVLVYADIIILIIMLCLIFLIPVGLIYYRTSKKFYRNPGIYLSGINTAGDTFRGSLGEDYGISLKNIYLDKIFNEKRYTLIGNASTLTLILIMFGIVAL